MLNNFPGEAEVQGDRGYDQVEPSVRQIVDDQSYDVSITGHEAENGDQTIDDPKTWKNSCEARKPVYAANNATTLVIRWTILCAAFTCRMPTTFHLEKPRV